MTELDRFLAVTDKDENYARRLCAFISEKRTVPFVPVSFSSVSDYLEFSESHALRLVTIAPIDEIGAELKIKNIRDENRELFEKLEEFDEKLEGLRKKD